MIRASFGGKCQWSVHRRRDKKENVNMNMKGNKTSRTNIRIMNMMGEIFGETAKENKKSEQKCIMKMHGVVRDMRVRHKTKIFREN